MNRLATSSYGEMSVLQDADVNERQTNTALGVFGHISTLKQMNLLITTRITGKYVKISKQSQASTFPFLPFLGKYVMIPGAFLFFPCTSFSLRTNFYVKGILGQMLTA